MNRKTLAAAAMTTALATGGVLGATLGSPTISGAQDTTTSTTTTTPSTDTTTASGSTADSADPGKGFRGGRGGFDLDVAAETLNMTVEELRTALTDGSTLAEVAEAQGVDRQTLVDALVAAGEARLDEAKAALPDRIDELVDSTLPAKGEGGPGRGHGGPGGPGLDAAAEALDMTVEELRTALADGSTLAEVAEAQGVERQALIDAMVAAAQERLDQAVADGKLTQAEADERAADLETRITERVDNAMPTGGFGGRGPGADTETGDSTTTTTTG